MCTADTQCPVGYVAGRYREAIGRPTRRAVPLLGAALTLLGALVIAAIQIGTGVDANVSFLVVRDAMPATPSGKIQKFKLRDMLSDGTL